MLFALFFSLCIAHSSVGVVFLIDESGSVNASDFTLETEAVTRALLRIPLATAVAVERFSDTCEQVVPLKFLHRLPSQPSSKPLPEALLVQSLKQQGGASNMHLALAKAAKMLDLFDTRIVVLLTDGGFSERKKTLQIAAALKSNGLQLIVARVGPIIDQSWIDKLASPGKGFHLCHEFQLAEMIGSMLASPGPYLVLLDIKLAVSSSNIKMISLSCAMVCFAVAVYFFFRRCRNGKVSVSDGDDSDDDDQDCACQETPKNLKNQKETPAPTQQMPNAPESVLVIAA